MSARLTKRAELALRDVAHSVGQAAGELDDALLRISTAYSSPTSQEPSPVAAAVANICVEVRHYALAPRLVVATARGSADRVQLIEQLERCVGGRDLIKDLRACDAWYDHGLMESEDGQRALELVGRIHALAPNLLAWIREMDHS